MISTLVVMSSPLPGREKDYAEWYVEQHLADVVRTPGVISGAFYESALPEPSPRWFHAARFDVDQPIAEVVLEIRRRSGGPQMPPTDAIDSKKTLMLGAYPRGPRVVGAAESGSVALYLVLSKPLEGKANEYNQWYDTQHLPDVLAVPGFFACQRFNLAPETGGKSSPWDYMGLYEIDRARIGETLAEAKSRAGGPKMPLPVPPLSAPGTYVGVFRQIA